MSSSSLTLLRFTCSAPRWENTTQQRPHSHQPPSRSVLSWFVIATLVSSLPQIQGGMFPWRDGKASTSSTIRETAATSSSSSTTRSTNTASPTRRGDGSGSAVRWVSTKMKSRDDEYSFNQDDQDDNYVDSAPPQEQWWKDPFAMFETETGLEEMEDWSTLPNDVPPSTVTEPIPAVPETKNEDELFVGDEEQEESPLSNDISAVDVLENDNESSSSPIPNTSATDNDVLAVTSTDGMLSSSNASSESEMAPSTPPADTEGDDSQTDSISLAPPSLSTSDTTDKTETRTATTVVPTITTSEAVDDDNTEEEKTDPKGETLPDTVGPISSETVPTTNSSTSPHPVKVTRKAARWIPRPALAAVGGGGGNPIKEDGNPEDETNADSTRTTTDDPAPSIQVTSEDSSSALSTVVVAMTALTTQLVATISGMVRSNQFQSFRDQITSAALLQAGALLVLSKTMVDYSMKWWQQRRGIEKEEEDGRPMATTTDNGMPSVSSSSSAVREDPADTPTTRRWSKWFRRPSWSLFPVRATSSLSTSSTLKSNDPVAVQQQCQQALHDKATIEKEYEKANWQLQQTQAELDALKQTSRYLQAQVRDQEELLERAIQAERRKAKEDMARLKEGMVKLIQKERESMREEFLKQAAELQTMWREQQQQQQAPPPQQLQPTPPPMPLKRRVRQYKNNVEEEEDDEEEDDDEVDNLGKDPIVAQQED